MGLCDKEAFLKHNRAPLELRHDIAALGLLHKIQLGEAHADFDDLFPKQIEAASASTRHGARRQGRQFHEHWGNSYYLNQSLFGLTRLYNVLPEYVASRPTVAAFQSALTKDARFACQTGQANWIVMYHTRNYSWR